MADKALTNPQGAHGYADLTTQGWSTSAPVKANAAITGPAVVSIAADGGVVTATTSVAAGLCIGIAMDSAALGRTTRVVVHGMAENVPADGAIAAGDIVKRSTTTAGSVIVAATPAGGEQLGVAISAAAGGVVDVWVGGVEQMPPGEVVRIRNVGDEEWSGGYDQNVYRVKAGHEAVVPREASWHWFGRPHVVDNGRDKSRSDEIKRLDVLYGLFDDPMGSVAEKRETNVPKVEVYDLEGERIFTVLDDPSGERLTPADTTAFEKELLDGQIQKLQRELAALTSAMAQADTSPEYEPSPDVVEEVPDDTPKKVPVSDGPRRGRVNRGS